MGYYDDGEEVVGVAEDFLDGEWDLDWEIIQEEELESEWELEWEQEC